MGLDIGPHVKNVGAGVRRFSPCLVVAVAVLQPPKALAEIRSKSREKWTNSNPIGTEFCLACQDEKDLYQSIVFTVYCHYS